MSTSMVFGKVSEHGTWMAHPNVGAMLADLGFLLLLALWSIRVGTWLVAVWRPDPSNRPALDRVERVALGIPLALGLLALTTLVLGLVGCLNRVGLAAGIGLLTLSAAGLARRVNRPSTPGFGDPFFIAARRGWTWLVAVPLALAGLATLVNALAPPTDGDALCYHLQVPKQFLIEGRVSYNPDQFETIYPMLTEMLYVVGLELGGPVACRLIHWWLGVAGVVAVFALGRGCAGPEAGWWAAAIAALTPAATAGMVAPLNDVALASWSAAAVLAWVVVMAMNEAKTCPSVRGTTLAGTMLGLTLGVKYPALILAGLLGLATLIRAPRRVGAYLLAAALVGGIWFGRAFLATGNPVYPFLHDLFGTGLVEASEARWRPLDPTPLNLMGALIPLSLDPLRFESRPHQLGPLWLMTLPLLILIRPRPDRRVIGLVILGWALIVLIMSQRQSPRFLLPALGPLAVGAGWVASSLASRRDLLARAACGLIVGVLLLQAAWAGARARVVWPYVTGKESALAYLETREPTVVVGRWMAAHLPETAVVVGQDHRGFYLPRRYVMELAHRRRTFWGRDPHQPPGSPEDIVATLRARGFTHLLTAEPVPLDAVEFDPTLTTWLAPLLKGTTPMWQAVLSDGDGLFRRYRVDDLERLAQDAPRVALDRRE